MRSKPRVLVLGDQRMTPIDEFDTLLLRGDFERRDSSCVHKLDDLILMRSGGAIVVRGGRVDAPCTVRAPFVPRVRSKSYTCSPRPSFRRPTSSA